MYKKIQHVVFIVIFGFLTISCENKSDLQLQIINIENKGYHKLDNYLNDKSVIGLGEFSHGDGPLFEIKTDLIEYLHTELGYEAILMESDFLAVDNTLNALGSKSLKEAANVGVQSTWADSKEFSSLMKYIKTSIDKNDTLYFHGIDPQMTGKESLQIHLLRANSIKDYISIQKYQDLKSCIRLLKTKNISFVTLDSLRYLRNSVSEISNRERLLPKSIQWLKNIQGGLDGLILVKSAPPVTPDNIPAIFSHPNYLKASAIRDSLMAENVQYYLKKYKKVIIWAANKHLKTESSPEISMGKLLKQTLGDEYYSILVLYHHGSWSYPNGERQGKIPEPAQGTLADKIDKQTNVSVGFLDVNKNKIPRMIIRDNNWTNTDSININNYCDALLYVRNASGSNMITDQ